MKSLKYIIISLLIISLVKKTMPILHESTINERMSTQGTLQHTRHSDRDIETKKQHKKRYRSTIKKYNPDQKTATANIVYVGVEEYSQATTPPNVTIPAMVPFGTITEKHTPQEKQLLGGKIHITTLWGIPVYGHRKPIKETETNFTIGYLWLSQDSVFGIAQMNDGKTFVGVIDDHQPNYIRSGKHRPGKTGLVWTWYSPEESLDLQEKYGIAAPSFTSVQEIGKVKINRQIYKLYGILLPSLNDFQSQTTPNMFTSNVNSFMNSGYSKFNVSNNTDAIQPIHPIVLNYLAQKWLNKKINE